MTKIKVLPKPHKYAVCAPEDTPIKEFYKDFYNEVFIFYHPFIKPKSIDYELFEPETYPGKNEIIEKCELVTWQQFLILSGIQNYSFLDIGLRIQVLGLKKQYANEETAKTIRDTCEKHRIIAPTEGFFPEFLMNKILRSLQHEGHEWIWSGDEFCTERKLEYIDDLINDNEALRNQHLSLFTHNNEVLLTTHWDSHFSLLCSDKKAISKIVKFAGLEGYYCDDKSEIYWSLQNTLLN
ncbi:hypothetical protein ASG89_33500 [Paenibacillus sp. Soil766]|uniref:DUF2711 family protein n=1 Tax=Paenibacillus sp. Soil766 TaxID=1736404 RepID=UPI00070AFA51|nr:DUF2711 family protein [Paenibacillus sp. Soil766]KRE92168.1 hypothetical protein ASG89_33500 [Paenibacillus sp. Soil766]